MHHLRHTNCQALNSTISSRPLRGEDDSNIAVTRAIPSQRRLTHQMLKLWKSIQDAQALEAFSGPPIFVVSHHTEQLRDYITRLNTLRSGDICYSTHSLDRSSLSSSSKRSKVRERLKDSRIDPAASPDLHISIYFN